MLYLCKENGGNNMLKQKEWIDVIVAKTGCTRKEAKIYYDCVFDYMREQISEEEPIKISGFGVFKLRKTAAKEQINLNTGMAEIVPEHNVVVFKPYFEIEPKPEAIDVEDDEVAENVVVHEVEEVEDTTTVVTEEVIEEDGITWIYKGEKMTTNKVAEVLQSKTSLTADDISSSLNVVKLNMKRLNKTEVEVKEEADSFNFVILK